MMTSSLPPSPPPPPTQAETSPIKKPPSRRGDRPHSSKSLAPQLKRSISGNPTSSPKISPRTMNRAKSSIEDHGLSPPREEQAPSVRRGDRPHSSKSLAPQLKRSISGNPTSSPKISPRTMNRAKSSIEDHGLSPPREEQAPSVRRGDRPHSSKSLVAPQLKRSISGNPTSSPKISPRTMNRAKSSIGDHGLSPPREELAPSVRRRATRTPASAPGRRNGLETLSDHFRKDGNKLPTIDLQSTSRSTYTSISKAKAGASKRSSRLRSSQDDSMLVRARRVKDRSVNSDLESPRRRVQDRSVNSDLESPRTPTRRRTLMSPIKSAESPQITTEDESARSQAGGRSASDDAETEAQTPRSKSKASMSRRVRRSNRSDINASVSNIDVVSSSVSMSSSASVTTDGDSSVVSSNSRRRRITSLSSPVSPVSAQSESLVSEDKPRPRRRNTDSSSVTSGASETIPREPRRLVQLNDSNDATQVAELASFLRNEDAKPSTIASSRSVSSMPKPRPRRASDRPFAGGQKRSIRNPTKLRIVKSDDEGIAEDVLEKKASLRNLRACLTDEEDELEDSEGGDSLNISDLLTGRHGKLSGKDERRSARHYSAGRSAIFSDGEIGVDSDQVDPNAHDRMGMSMPGMSEKVMELSALVQQQKAQKILSKTENDTENGEDKGEDIFTFYSWSTSRQRRSKILKERKKLRDSVREGPLLASYEALMRMD